MKNLLVKLLPLLTIVIAAPAFAGTDDFNHDRHNRIETSRNHGYIQVVDRRDYYRRGERLRQIKLQREREREARRHYEGREYHEARGHHEDRGYYDNYRHR